MEKVVTGQLSPEMMGISILLSRLVAEVGYSRTKDIHAFADWLSKLSGVVAADIESVSIPGVPESAEKQVKDAAKSATGFVFSRCRFDADA